MTTRGVAAEAYREGLPVLAASAGAGLFAGVVLGGMRADLRAVSGLLVLVPALLATRGNVYGALGARLATGLHQGLVEPSAPGDERVRAAVAAALVDGLLVSAAAAGVAYAALVALSRDPASLAALVAIALVSGAASGAVLAVVVVLSAFAGYRRGVNPDTIVGPVVTTTGDVVGMAALLAAVRLVVALGGG